MIAFGYLSVARNVKRLNPTLKIYYYNVLRSKLYFHTICFTIADIASLACPICCPLGNQ